MGWDKQQKAFNHLIEINDKQGYITFDDIIICVENLNLPINEVDWLTNSITIRGIVIYDEIPSQVVSINDYDDYAQSDYDAIFNRVVQLDTSLEFFINEVRNIVPPQYKEASRLINLVREGNLYARNRMIEMHLRTAVKIALKQAETYNYDIVDAIGDACVGLIVAVDRYDPDNNGAFTSYASLWIFQNITREQPTKNPHIYFPVHKKEGFFSMYPLLKENGCLVCKNIGDCSELETMISKELKSTGEQTRELINAFVTSESFEYFSEQNSDYIGSLISDINIEREFEDKSLGYLIDDLLNVLTVRERYIIEERYGLNGENTKTLEELGGVLGVTRERIRQIESKALQKLGHPSRAKKIKNYW